MEHKKKLRPDQRVRTQTAFKNLIEKGSFARGEFFYLWADKQVATGKKTRRTRPMLGVIVGRKFDARATKRNERKRNIREIFRKHQNELNGQSVFLIKAKERRGRPSFFAMEQDLLGLFKKTGSLP